MASFRLEMKTLPFEAAYTKELLLLLRCQPHVIYLMVTLPFCAYNLIRLQGLFIFGIQKWLNSPTGGSKRPMPHATRPPASRAEEAISDRQHLLAAALEITQRSEGRQLFQPLPKVHTSFIKEWTETNPRSYWYIVHSRDLVSAPSRHLRSHKRRHEANEFQPSSILLPKGKQYEIPKIHKGNSISSIGI